MIVLACTLLLASGCADAALSAVPPVEQVGSAQGLNAQTALREVNAYRRAHGLKPVVLDQRLIQASHLGAVSSKPGQDRPPRPRRVEAVGSGKERRL